MCTDKITLTCLASTLCSTANTGWVMYAYLSVSRRELNSGDPVFILSERD